MLVASILCLKVGLVAGKLVAERGDASFPSFVRWLTSKVLIVNHHHDENEKSHSCYLSSASSTRIPHNQDHKDVCFKTGESRDCTMNPHWLPLQARWQFQTYIGTKRNILLQEVNKKLCKVILMQHLMIWNTKYVWTLGLI